LLLCDIEGGFSAWKDGGRSRHRVVATLGRLDKLQERGQLDALLASGARLARSLLLLSEHAQGSLPTISIRHIGPALVFQRLWQQTGRQQVIEQLLKGRRFEFPLPAATRTTSRKHSSPDGATCSLRSSWGSDVMTGLNAPALTEGLTWQKTEFCRLRPGWFGVIQ
jgi:hypothetical protein